MAGAEGFVFEMVERLEEESIPYVRDRVMKDRLAHWRAALKAETI